eukprot:535512_1
MDINILVIVIYGSIQLAIGIAVSIIGAIHVRQSLQSEKTTITSPSTSDNTITTKPQTLEGINLIEKQKEENKEESADIQSKSDDKGACVLWIKTVWKMRRVYAGLAVHSFDVLMDVLVILKWLQTPNRENDNIDPRL